MAPNEAPPGNAAPPRKRAGWKPAVPGSAPRYQKRTVSAALPLKSRLPLRAAA